MHIVRQVVATTAVSALARFGGLLASVLVIPLVVRVHGVSILGAYTIILGIGAVLTVLDTGLGSAIRDSVVTADSAKPPIAALTGAGYLLASVVAMFGVALSVVAPWSMLLGPTANVAAHQMTAMGVTYSVVYAAGIGLSAHARILEGLDRPRAVAWRSLAAVGLGAGLQVAALALHAPLFVLSATIATPPAIAGLLCRVALRESVGRDERTSLSDSISQLRLLLPTAWPMMVIGVGVAVAYGQDSLIVAHELGLAAAAEYGVAAKLGQMLTLVATASVPVLWTHYARHRVSQHGPASIKSLTVTFGAAGLSLSVLYAVAAPTAARVLLAGARGLSPSLTVGFAVFGALLITHQPLAMANTDAKGLRFQALTITIMALVNLPLSVGLASTIGISGPVWASVICLAAFHVIPLAVRHRRQHSEAASWPNRVDEQPLSVSGL